MQRVTVLCVGKLKEKFYLEAAAEFAARMAQCGTRCIILAHLSRENNTPQRAWDTVQRRLNTVEAEVLLEVAPRSEVSPPYGMEVPVCSE